ncbi:hypothetical protein B0O80DRAFT_432870 [Mortierella sp. GBAus27b]|nr:hypothetical protein B0O80DRAFT_432870 [Mortierella sp. GBAus27b]
MTKWLNYKNWGMAAALSDIWWASDPRRNASSGAFTPSSMIPSALRPGGNGTPPSTYVVVRVKGEWLRKGFGVQEERAVKILKEACHKVKDSELGVRPQDGVEGNDDDYSKTVGLGSGQSTNGEKRLQAKNNNTWTTYPFPADSPLAQQQRRAASGGVEPETLSKVTRYHQKYPQRLQPPTAMRTADLGDFESCGEEALFVDHEGACHVKI